MRIAPCSAILALMASFACRPPEYKALQSSPPIIEVAVSVRADADDAQNLEREIAAALRARLATLATVVPEGVTPPPGSTRLQIEIDSIARKNISPAAAGAVAGVAIGTLSAASRNDRGHGGGGNGMLALLEGLIWGIEVAADVEASQRHRELMLGYVPPRIRGFMALSHSGSTRPIYAENISSRSIIDEMRPLREAERRDAAYVDEELAMALAKAVANKLRHKFDWRANKEPSWYRAVNEQD